MSELIICGIGKNGKDFYNFLKFAGYEDRIAGITDIRADDIKEYMGIPVAPLDNYLAEDRGYYFCITPDIPDAKEYYWNILNGKRTSDFRDMEFIAEALSANLTEINRNYIAYVHVSEMDKYFDEAESEKAMAVFWSAEGIFRKLFDKLNLENVIELACGRGRHVPNYIDRAGRITLVDILEKNIDICKKRFKDKTNIEYYNNNGFDLNQLRSNEYTGLFCYDAMVHFELLDIYSYLKDINRVMIPGGRALIHHSNNDEYTVNSFRRAQRDKGGRNFMSDKLFAYLSEHAGFKVIEQRIIDWGGVSALDCISLIEKPIY